MFKWALVIIALIGLWFPSWLSGTGSIIHERFTIGEWHPQWNTLLTLVIVVAAFRVKGK